MRSKQMYYILIIALIFTGVTVVLLNQLYFNTLGMAEQINDLGRIRGGIQRISKLELDHKESTALIHEIDTLINQGISFYDNHSSGFANIVSNLELIKGKWESEKKLIFEYRSSNSDELKAQIVDLSEDIWYFADQTVTLSQLAEENNTSKIKFFSVFFAMFGIVIVLTIKFVRQYVRDKLESGANKDYMTNLYNRKFMMSYLELSISRMERNIKSLSVFMIDIDHFKSVNDEYGHSTGDRVIIEVAKILQESVRSSDLVCRYGGEEFVILMTDCDSKSVKVIGEKVRENVELAQFSIDKEITISLGIGVYDQGDSIKTLIDKADIAMYEAKNNGRNQVVVYTGER